MRVGIAPTTPALVQSATIYIHLSNSGLTRLSWGYLFVLPPSLTFCNYYSTLDAKCQAFFEIFFAVAQSTRTFNGCALSLPYLFVYRMEVLLVKYTDWVLYPFASLLRVGSLMRLKEGLLRGAFHTHPKGVTTRA